MSDTKISDLSLDHLVMLLADEGPNDMQLVALADLVRRASRAEDLAEALEHYTRAVDRRGYPDSSIARKALAHYRGEK
jgi:hypothetical protein